MVSFKKEIWKIENKNRINRISRKSYKKRRSESFLVRKKSILYRAKDRAKRFGREFDITEEDVLWNTVCPIFKIPIDYEVKGSPSNNSPALDRIDNSMGYIRGNVRVISQRANELKRDATYEEIKLLYENFFEV